MKTFASSALRNVRRTALAIGTVAIGVTSMASVSSAAEEVNLYSYRQPFLINPILEAFTAETGIQVNTVHAKKGIVERLKSEGEASPADVVLTVDVGRLHDLVEADLVQPVASDVLSANIPSQYRHPDGKWYGLTVRGRVIYASVDRTEPGEVNSYADLTAPALKGRVCTRSGKNLYNVSLIASVIAHQGEENAKAWLTDLRDNLAQKPQGNDRAQAKAISEGVCDYALANTYYYGKMATNEKNPEQKDWAEAVRIIFPNQDDRGTHVNISGAVVTKHAPNVDNAVKLLEYLSSDEAQRLYAEQNFEYPVKDGIELHPLVASWGNFNADTINLDEVAKQRAAASRMVDEVAYDFGPQSGS